MKPVVGEAKSARRQADNLGPMTVETAPRMSPPVIVLMLTLLLGVQPITTDLYLPALPSLSLSLNASVATVKTAVTEPKRSQSPLCLCKAPPRIYHP